jgi:hypothetical protein
MIRTIPVSSPESLSRDRAFHQTPGGRGDRDE